MALCKNSSDRFESGTCVVEWGHVKSQSDKNSVKRQSYENIEDKVTSLPLECIHILDDDDDIDSDVSVNSDVSSTSNSDDEFNEYLSPTTSTRPSVDLNSSERTTELTLPQSCSQYNKHRLKIQFVFGNTLLPDHPIDTSNLDIIKEDSNIVNEDKQNSMGDWEVHTRGIGSRLLASMGYPGYGGLGRCHQGRQSPVCTNLEKYQVHNIKWKYRPSLDNVVLSQKYAKNTALHEKNSIKKSSKKPSNPISSHSGSVFKLINMALLSKSSGNDQTLTNLTNTDNNNNTKSILTSQISPTNCNETILKRKLFHTHEQINRIHNQIIKAQDAVKRNEGRDRFAVKQAQQRVHDLQSQLIQLKESEKTIVNIQNKQIKEKKLRIF
uniref:SJCHGC06404 protein n=1 Tax=Schistosoma japonicum TaxID=6182 RepID=Q5DGL0_SCHJA|nr:SJCHGC06404 protein [Schistosoma japonicum]